MIVCLCKGVSEQKIRWLVQNGATTVRDVMQACKAGTDCGSCACQVRDLVEEARETATDDATATTASSIANA